jgi:transposase-like protein
LFSQISHFKLRLSYRDVDKILLIKDVKVDHSTIQRWALKFSKEIEKNMQSRKRNICRSWRMEEEVKLLKSKRQSREY